MLPFSQQPHSTTSSGSHGPVVDCKAFPERCPPSSTHPGLRTSHRHPLTDPAEVLKTNIRSPTLAQAPPPSLHSFDIARTRDLDASDNPAPPATSIPLSPSSLSLYHNREPEPLSLKPYRAKSNMIPLSLFFNSLTYSPVRPDLHQTRPNL